MFLGIGFQLIEDEEDMLWTRNVREKTEEVAARGLKFLEGRGSQQSLSMLVQSILSTSIAPGVSHNSGQTKMGTNEEFGKNTILKLMDAKDEYFSDPLRQFDKHFLMPIEDVFLTQGRETAMTGCVEQSTIKVGEEVEVLGLTQAGLLKTTVTGVEIFKKILDRGQAGNNVGLLLCGPKHDDMQ